MSHFPKLCIAYNGHRVLTCMVWLENTAMKIPSKPYNSHMRSSGDLLLQSLEEVLSFTELGKYSGPVPAVVGCGLMMDDAWTASHTPCSRERSFEMTVLDPTGLLAPGHNLERIQARRAPPLEGRLLQAPRLSFPASSGDRGGHGRGFGQRIPAGRSVRGQAAGECVSTQIRKCYGFLG